MRTRMRGPATAPGPRVQRPIRRAKRLANARTVACALRSRLSTFGGSPAAPRLDGPRRFSCVPRRMHFDGHGVNQLDHQMRDRPGTSYRAFRAPECQRKRRLSDGEFVAPFVDEFGHLPEAFRQGRPVVRFGAEISCLARDVLRGILRARSGRCLGDKTAHL